MDYIKELKKRKGLRSLLVEKYNNIGNPIPEFIVKNGGRLAFLPTHIASGGVIDYHFYGIARKFGLIPVWLPFVSDKFQSFNKRKKMYLHTFDKFGVIKKLTNPNKWEGKTFSEIKLDPRESLVKYHLKKWREIPNPKMLIEMSEWLQFFGKAQDYYFHEMSLYSAFGIKFWPNIPEFYNKGEKESFIAEVINPAIEKVISEYGVKPLEATFDIKPLLF